MLDVLNLNFILCREQHGLRIHLGQLKVLDALDRILVHIFLLNRLLFISRFVKYFLQAFGPGGVGLKAFNVHLANLVILVLMRIPLEMRRFAFSYLLTALRLPCL